MEIIGIFLVSHQANLYINIVDEISYTTHQDHWAKTSALLFPTR